MPINGSIRLWLRDALIVELSERRRLGNYYGLDPVYDNVEAEEVER
jgi:hypothetical protein